MANIPNTNNIEKRRLEEILSIKEFALQCRNKWWLFALSVLVCMSAAVLYLKITPKEYTRYAAVMIKEDSRSGAASFQSQLADMGNLAPFSSASDVQNEILYMQSPDITLQTVKRLGLDYDYTEKGFWGHRTLYGSELPVRVQINDVADEQGVRMKLHLDKDKVTITDIETYQNGEKLRDPKKYSGTMDSVIETSVGGISVIRNAGHLAAGPRTIEVSRSGFYNATMAWQKRLTYTLNNKLASVIDIVCNDVVPQRAEDVLNTIISVYNECWVRDKNTMAVSTSQFIADRIKVIESELGSVDSDITSIKSGNQMVDVAEANIQALGQTTASEGAIRNMSNELYMVEYIIQYIKDDSSYRLLPAGMGISSTSIQSQISSYNDLVLQRNSIVNNSSEHNRLVLDIDTRLASLKDAIVLSLENERTSLKSGIAAEQKNIRNYENKIIKSPVQEQELISVERQQKIKESLYLFLLQKREENEMSQAFTAYNTRIVTTPQGGMTPTSPDSRKVCLLAFVLSLLLPLVYLYFRTRFNTKVRGKKDIEGVTVPFIGEIPLYRQSRKDRKKKLGMQVVFDARSRRPINEAFRVVRTNIEFMLSSAGENRNVIMDASLNPSSGKSFIIANVAASVAQKGKKVVIVDLDFRHSTISELVGKPSSGICNYIAGLSDTCDPIAVEGTDGLSVIPAGTTPPNPTELLFNPRLEALIGELRRKYDFVFLDCPPVDIVADTSIIAQWADMTMFVIRAGLMERAQIPELEQIYAEKKFSNMCVLLNAIEDSGGRYGYHYGYHYGYGNYYGGK